VNRRIVSGKACLAGLVLALGGLAQNSAVASETEAKAIMQTRCVACHGTEDPNKWIRISELRKTPEGWALTLDRMRKRRGVQLTAEEERTLVKYLADTRGLAPAESAPFRYVLEQRPNVVETPDPVLTEMCARCHSRARPGLQHRTQTEWERLVHFHVGEFPTIELHALARDRQWFNIAINEVVPYLAKSNSYQSEAWTQWQSQPKADLSGNWRVAGYMPVDGSYDATMSVARSADDQYRVELKGHYASGKPLEGLGAATVFTGYEWRASIKIDGQPVQQVLAASEDGQGMNGRMFLAEHDEIGGEVKAVKADAAPAILSVSPSYLRRGQSTEVTVVGVGLDGAISFGPGIDVEPVSRSADKLVLKVTAGADSAPAAHALQVGSARLDAALAVYDKVARVDVVPAMSIARIGGNGGPIPKMQSTYRAMAYAAGKDGKPGTEDDLALGYMPASWSVKNFDEVAEHDKDVDFAGAIDAATGVFTPGDAGPNPKRRMDTNNVGNLAVVAKVDDAGEAVSGEGHLVVTVQTFVKPRMW